MRTPLPQPIALGGSSAAEPKKLSFLSLPGEVRNIVYDMFFRGPNQVQLERSGDGHRPVHHDFKQSISNGLPLLLLCRQVYHEAAAVLLSGNDFIVTMPERFIFEFRDTDVEQATFAAQWLRTLGSGTSMLRKVHIDLSHSLGIEPDQSSSRWSRWGRDFPDLHTAIQLRDLSEMMWTSRNPCINISFVHVPVEPESCPRPNEHFTAAQTGIDESTLNNFLMIFQHDPLNLQQYLPQIKEILILRDCTEGAVIYSRHVRRDFAIAHQGNNVTWKQSSPLTLMGLPSDIKEQIFGFVTCDTTQAVHDLDEKSITGSTHALIAVCQELRQTHDNLYWNSTQHVFKMCTDQLSTDFDQFRRLERSWCLNSTQRHPWATGYRQICSMPEFSLQFRLPEYIGLEDISIDVLPLIRVTSYASGQPAQVTISIIDDHDTVRIQHSLSLKELRVYALIALSEYAHQYPRDQDLACPSIWMNGRGRILEVQSGQKATDPQPYIDEYLKVRAADEHCGPYDWCDPIHEMYGVGTVEPNDSSWYWHEEYAPCHRRRFHGKLRAYLGYLQRIGLGDDARYWADMCKYP
jgi:hypothetical protein